ncbi:MAG: helix-turn-helix transcriptional regulator [Bryobacterales bacterium]|nr:helix-turn-helix domain-containing protein [Bryobacteraceae bacterium]MDW8355098.1 helix-turn-helix transcriptional regulator [Bryobacterales bacterium]
MEGAGEGKRSVGWPDLAAVRESRGITLDSIAQMTKISKRFLEAIEAGEFAKLPGGIFNTSYIRQYARAIEYDEIELVQKYRVLSRDYEPPVNASSASNKPASRWLTLLQLS